MHTDKEHAEKIYQAVKENLIAQIKQMMIHKVTFSDMDATDDSMISITIVGRQTH